MVSGVVGIEVGTVTKVLGGSERRSFSYGNQAATTSSKLHNLLLIGERAASPWVAKSYVFGDLFRDEGSTLNSIALGAPLTGSDSAKSLQRM
jgi:hypothetical protein